MKLPEEFKNKMEELLGRAEFEDFMKSYQEPRYFGLRINTLKVDVDSFLKLSPFCLQPVPWTRDGFYYSEGETPGKHPYYYAGLYYIQEPSAMLPGEVINAQPGEHVLDLCAAPGGKTVQMAARMKGRGILVANDINTDRVKALVKNVELCGVRNVIVTNEQPENLARNFKGYFDRILVDAPCSGEGMFRKDEEAARSWENFKCEKCSVMQWDILQNLDIMLKPGGTIVYSTCTFSPEEDEQMIARFLDKYSDYILPEIPKTGGINHGRPEWGFGRAEMANTARLWPHKLKGEGHFTAVLRKQPVTEIGETLIAKDKTAIAGYKTPIAKDKTVEDPRFFNDESLHIKALGTMKPNEKNSKKQIRTGKSLATVAPAQIPSPREALEALKQFETENMNTAVEGYFTLKGSNLYCLPEIPPALDGIKVAKFGWYLGEVIRGRLQPSHSLVLSLKREDLKRTLNLKSTFREVTSYLKGETLEADGKGLTAVCVDGFTLGWGKLGGGILKNLYPKGWRKMV